MLPVDIDPWWEPGCPICGSTYVVSNKKYAGDC